MHRLALLKSISRSTQSTKSLPLQLAYSRNGWTFHAKGIWWLLEPNSDGMVVVETYIGSSNLSYRSWWRDFELGFVVRSNFSSQTEDEKKKFLSLSEELSFLNENCNLQSFEKIGSSKNFVSILSAKLEFLIVSLLTVSFRSFL
jgi:phosphatidylserine/phosphatidylglycerophosphate/cardiolipin synthase-like enzyme